MVDSDPTRRRSRSELDAIADGTSDGSRLSEFVSEMRSLGDNAGVEPNRALTEFVSAPGREHDIVVASAATDSPKARIPVIAQLSALAATTIGKVALTGGVAAAAVEPARHADHDALDAMLLDQRSERPDRTAVVAPFESREREGETSLRIGDCEADAALSEVDGEGSQSRLRVSPGGPRFGATPVLESRRSEQAETPQYRG